MTNRNAKTSRGAETQKGSQPLKEETISHTNSLRHRLGPSDNGRAIVACREGSDASETNCSPITSEKVWQPSRQPSCLTEGVTSNRPLDKAGPSRGRVSSQQHRPRGPPKGRSESSRRWLDRTPYLLWATGCRRRKCGPRRRSTQKR